MDNITKLFIYSDEITRNDILITPNIDFMKSLNYKCLTIKQCPNISQYLIDNNIEKLGHCILHVIDYSFKYIMSNREIIKSQNYVFIYYGDIHPSVKKERTLRRIESLELIMNSPNTFIYCSVSYLIGKYYPFFPQNKIIHNIYNSINDNFILEEKVNMNPSNTILLSGSVGMYYPARKRMLNLMNNNDMIVRLKSNDPTIIEKKYMYNLREHLCCFACSLTHEIPYIVFKVFEIPASGSLLLMCDYTVKEHMLKLGFIDGQNYISCTMKNMNDKIKYILDPINRDEIDRIRINGYNFVLKYHKMSDRMKLLDNIITSIVNHQL